MTITTDNECIKCQYGIVEEQSKALVYVNCTKRDKKYMYGQCIYCDDFYKKGRED